jgi:hypothetical protein
MTDNTKVLDALAKLDKTNAAHWTDDGLPRVNVVQELAEDTSLTRAMLNEIAPGFSRNPPAPKASGDETGGAPPAVAKDTTNLDNEFDESAEPEVNGPGEQLTEDQVRAILTRRIGDAELRLEDARRAVNDANVELRRAEQRVTRAIYDSNRRFPPISAAANIKAHLKAQQDRLMAEVEARGGYGVGQLDQAMQKRNSRGWSRPSRPVQNAAAA